MGTRRLLNANEHTPQNLIHIELVSQCHRGTDNQRQQLPPINREETYLGSVIGVTTVGRIYHRPDT
jgi:hypothetical protein